MRWGIQWLVLPTRLLLYLARCWVFIMWWGIQGLRGFLPSDVTEALPVGVYYWSITGFYHDSVVGGETFT